MAEQTVEDLVVKMRSDGTEQTADDLEDSGDQFKRTAEQSEDSADVLEENSSKWDRAMGVIVTGLIVAAGALASQVPILGELFSGMFSVLEAVAFQLDQVLRPALQPVTDSLFELSGAIYEAESAGDVIIAFLENWKGTLALIASAVGVVLLALFKLVGVMVTLGAIKSALVTAAVAVGAAISALGAPIVALIAVIVAAIAILAAYIFNFRGFRDSANEIAMGLYNDLVQWFEDLWADTVEIFSNLVSDILSWWENLKADTKTIVSDFIADVKQWGKDLINAFIEGIQAVASNIGTVIQTQVTERVEGSVVGQLIGGAQNAVGLDTSDQMGSSSNGSGNVYIDGRRVDEQQGRYRKDSVLGRGRQ